VNSVLDNTLVGLALVVSAGYALTSLGPRSVRRRLLASLSRMTARAPAFLGLRRMSERLAASAGKAQGACGGCDNCGAEKTPAPAPGAEVNVPVAKIGRRT
jgi:hypothetical protein